MKKLLATMLSIALLAAFPAAALADQETGNAVLELESGNLTLITDPEVIKDLPSGYQGLGALSFDFGANDLTGYAQTLTTGQKAGLLVQDARGQGDTSIWHVTVQLEEFFLKGTQTETLQGSQLNFTMIENSVFPNTAAKPSMTTVGLAPGGRATQIFNSSAAGSPGLWGASWTPTLDIPGNAVKGEHQARLVWTLGPDIFIPNP